MKVLVCGGREWSDEEPVRRELAALMRRERLDPVDVEVIHGASRGADRIGGEVARELGMALTTVPADWRTHGRSAGIIRNREMLEMGPDVVLAFHADLGKSKGTRNMVSLAREAGIETSVFSA